MKKLFILFVLLFGLIAINGCTPNSVEEDETNTIYNVDRTKVKKPGDQGGNNNGG